MFDVVALGETLIDFTPGGANAQGVKLFACNPGGAPANVLAMNARLGGKTAFIGKVGRDSFGSFLRKTMVQCGIDTTGLIADEKLPAVFFILAQFRLRLTPTALPLWRRRAMQRRRES